MAIDDQLPTEIAPARVSRLLTADEFHRLADVPPEVEWFANLSCHFEHYLAWDFEDYLAQSSGPVDALSVKRPMSGHS